MVRLHVNLRRRSLIAPGNGIYFFFEGAMGWNGLIAMYIPFITFGFWVLYFSYQSFRTRSGAWCINKTLRPVRAAG